MRTHEGRACRIAFVTPSRITWAAAAAHVIREGVTNAILHARPSWVRIRLSPTGVVVSNDGYSASYAASTAGAGSGLVGLSELVGDEGTLSWGASGKMWTISLTFPTTPRSEEDVSSDTVNSGKE